VRKRIDIFDPKRDNTRWLTLRGRTLLEEQTEAAGILKRNGSRGLDLELDPQPERTRVPLARPVRVTYEDGQVIEMRALL
jgi:hypothetical protein